MLNFRTLKKDLSPNVLKDGKELFDKDMVKSVKIESLTSTSISMSCQVIGSYEKEYLSKLEIDRRESMLIDSDCSCPQQYDCQHLAAVLFYLEGHLNELIVSYSSKGDVEAEDAKEKAEIKKTIKEAKKKEAIRKDKKHDKELLEEYLEASQILGRSPFFLIEEEITPDKAELVLFFNQLHEEDPNRGKWYEVQLALRLPFRSKLLNVTNIREFFETLRFDEALYIGNKRYHFSLSSFEEPSRTILTLLMDYVRFSESKEERCLRIAFIDVHAFGAVLAEIYDIAALRHVSLGSVRDEEPLVLPCIFFENGETPLMYSKVPAALQVAIEIIEATDPKILLNPRLRIAKDATITIEQAQLFECAKPGLLHDNTYYRFPKEIKRKHLRNIDPLRSITIPEPLFGTFIENSLPQLLQFSGTYNETVIERFVTLPFAGKLKAECEISYLEGELEAELFFIYKKIKVPAAISQVTVLDVIPFVTKDGILARNLTEEQSVIEDLFQDFTFDPVTGVYSTKLEKKIVEFMTEVVPRNQGRVTFHCPENLLEQFVYDDSTFELHLKEASHIDVYQVDLKVNGYLNGLTLDQLWDCLTSKRSYIELARKKPPKKKGSEKGSQSLAHKILVLDLDKLAPIVQIFDEIGINKLDDHKEERPLWSLASIDAEQFKNLPIKFSISKKLKEIQEQMLGIRPHKPGALPKEIDAKLRPYQIDGVSWLERLRLMHLSGILADDMGLGKTLQAIIAITQNKKIEPEAISIVVCPTSLLYNWEEEIHKFNSQLNCLVVDGTPVQRQKLLQNMKDVDIIITSYSLLQKDIDSYKDMNFSYAVLDEAQHIKNRGTRNAKSVKQLVAAHRLILTGTPIENSLEELWSLFDFLMPSLLSSYDRFLEKYIRDPKKSNVEKMDSLRRKVSPFILRRMKKEVLKELPPVSEIIYHCHLSDVQKELYHSYAKSAREELSALVKKEGFDRVQIHVLATLTRLKQICCHPAIFAKDKPEDGDSAKYDMLKELLQNLIDSNHKTVIFSQYTRMLSIMREDLNNQGIPFNYLDGASKNRLDIVKEFNQNKDIPIFLVSLKAGGSGLNLVGADTVVHYDMWWNPAVENQATDRVHRIGQKNTVSSYKLVTKGTIEDKIIEMQDRKRGLVKKVISCDEEAISKLTWEEVLELLQT